MESSPTKAEWYNKADIIKSLSAKGGFIDALKEGICSQAMETDIPIYMCKETRRVVTVPSIGRM